MVDVITGDCYMKLDQIKYATIVSNKVYNNMHK
jgi:hypothetical protein